mmetsp:Transcript_5899/g.16232  ORF Transcript_5899/g.16232 Transcript_5899/m.16232 type:complete len:246 (+) Transcript_5899:25-762(+)
MPGNAHKTNTHEGAQTRTTLLWRARKPECARHAAAVAGGAGGSPPAAPPAAAAASSASLALRSSSSRICMSNDFFRGLAFASPAGAASESPALAQSSKPPSGRASPPTSWPSGVVAISSACRFRRSSLRSSSAAEGFVAGQPTMSPRSCAQISHGLQPSASDANVAKSPTTTRPRLARVSITFNRRGSARKPTRPCVLARTVEMKINSFSRPWKPSTLLTSGTAALRPAPLSMPSLVRKTRACAA